MDQAVQSRLKRALFVAGVSGAFLIARPPVVHAQTPSEIATAKQWFGDGLAKEEKSDFTGALDLFRRAAQVKKTPQILYHVGLCESRTGALVEALVDLESAAAAARGAHADDVLTAANAELAEVKKRTPTLEVRTPDGTTPARFVVDAQSIALSMLRAPMPLNPGEHTVTVELTTGATATKKVTLAERDAIKVDLAPTGSAPPAPPTPAVTPARESAAPTPPAQEPSASPLPWILVGGGAAVAITGAVLFVVARGKASDLDANCPVRTACDPKYQSDYDSAKTLNALGIGLGAVGLVAAGVGISMLVLRPSSATASSASLVLSSRGIDLAARF